MPDFLKATTSTISVQVVIDGKPEDAAAVTVTVTDPDGTTVVSGAVALSLGDGWYQKTLTPANLAKVGTYRAHWDAVTAGSTLALDTIFTVGLSAYPSMTVTDIRHMTAETELGGFKTGKVSAYAAPTITVADWAHLPDKDLLGQYFYIYGGTGAGKGGTILTHTKGASGAEITTTPLGVTPDTTSQVEVHKHYTVPQYNKAIRRAQMAAADRLLVPMNDRTVTVAADQEVFDVPAGFVAIFAVLQDGTEIELDKWSVVPGRRQIKVEGATEGTNLEIQGGAPAGDILSDFAIVEVPPEYLINKVCAMLLRTGAGGPSTDPDASSQRAAFYEQMALAVLSRQPQRIKPDTRRV